MKSTLTKRLALTLAAGLLPLGAACTQVDEQEEVADGATQEDTTRPLSAALADVDGMSSLNKAIATAELGSVFDGPGSYTLLAPSDAAFEKLGDRAAALMTEEQRPVLVGLLREHIVPGHLTPESVDKAITQKGGPVTMTTVGGGTVSFAKSGDAIEVTSSSGSKAMFAGSATAASNGVVIPLDTVLLPKPEAS